MNKKNKWLRGICIFICCMLVLVFAAGCSDKNENEETFESEYKIGDKCVKNGLKIIATDFKTVEPTDEHKPALKKMFVQIDFRIENLNPEKHVISSHLMANASVKDKSNANSYLIMESDNAKNANPDFKTLSGVIESNGVLEGSLAYEVNSDWASINIQIKTIIDSNKNKDTVNFLIENK